MDKAIKFIKTPFKLALSIIAVVFTFLPEDMFGKVNLFPNVSCETKIVLVRLLMFIVIFVISVIINTVYLTCRKNIYIKGKNYIIHIKYGDIFKMQKCKKIINFDECFTTNVGDMPADIKLNSICGQYLNKNPIDNMNELIDNVNLKPARSKSKYNAQDRYESGTLVPNGDYLLLAFARLDEDGLGIMSYDEFLDCLSKLWREIDKYYGQNDVCIPILGSGITRLNDRSLTQQELLDVIISSYKLSSHKIKLPHKLYIVCRKEDDFSLNRIGEYV